MLHVISYIIVYCIVSVRSVHKYSDLLTRWLSVRKSLEHCLQELLYALCPPESRGVTWYICSSSFQRCGITVSIWWLLRGIRGLGRSPITPRYRSPLRHKNGPTFFSGTTTIAFNMVLIFMCSIHLSYCLIALSPRVIEVEEAVVVNPRFLPRVVEVAELSSAIHGILKNCGYGSRSSRVSKLYLKRGN